MISEAIILAGGLGTRLRSIIRDVPKPMARVGGKPFLEHLLIRLEKQGIKRVILSVGYRYESITDYFSTDFRGTKILYLIEEEPLGTGGAIKKALDCVCGENVFVLNGDTYFDIELRKFEKMHRKYKAQISIALKKLKNPSRYGVVELNQEKRVVGFLEKNKSGSVLINGGNYILRKNIFGHFNLGEKFSFETGFLARYLGELQVFGFTFNGYFVDIGVPEDFIQAKEYFAYSTFYSEP